MQLMTTSHVGPAISIGFGRVASRDTVDGLQEGEFANRDRAAETCNPLRWSTEDGRSCGSPGVPSCASIARCDHGKIMVRVAEARVRSRVGTSP